MQKNALSSRLTSFFILVALLLSIFIISHILRVDAGMGMGGVVRAKYPSLTIEPPDKAYKMGGVMSFPSSTSTAVYIGSNNLSGDAKITLYKTSEQNLLNYLLHDAKTIQKDKDISVSDFPKVVELTQRIKSGYDNKVLVTLPVSEARGIWYMTVELGNAKENAFLVKSNIGVVVVEAKDKYLFWAQDTTSHKSMSNVKIETYSLLDTKTSKGDATTSPDGTATIPFDATVDVALASLDGDFALVPINLSDLNYSNEYLKYPNFDGRYQKGTYYLFTDRPIYKPGDKMYFKAVVRDVLGEEYIVPDQMVQISIDKGYEGKPLFEKSYKLSGLGTLDGEFVIPKDIRPGYHYLTISLPSGDKRVTYDESSVYFNVEEYRKPEYELGLTTNPKLVVQADETIQAIVTGTYFSGQAMSGASVKYMVSMSDYYEYGYMMGGQNDQGVGVPDYQVWGQEVFSGVVNLDSSGVGVIEINPDSFKTKPKKNSIITISASLDDGSANVSARFQNLLIYSADVTVYRRYDDNLSILRAGGNTDVGYLIKPNSDQKKIDSVEAAYTVIYHDWVKSGERDDYGTDTYKEVKQEIKKVKNIRVNAKDFENFKATFPIAKAGSYEVILVVKDSSGRTNERADWVWVSEKGGYIRNAYDADINITLKTDKPKYGLDDIAKLTLSVPYENGNVLLVYGKNIVVGYEVLDVSSFESSANLTLKEGYAPRLATTAFGIVDKNLARGGSYVYFDTSSKKVNVYIKTDKEKYLPKDIASVSIKTADKNNIGVPSEVAVWAIDKALYELQDPNVGLIFDEFWDSQAANRFGFDFGGAAYAFETSYSFKNINYYDTAGGGGGCFTGDTKIQMADGTTKNISKVKVGDKVLTRNDKSSNVVIDTVTATHEVTENGYIVINNNLKVTPNHIIFVNNMWKKAGDLQIGDSLVDVTGKSVTVDNIDLVRTKEKVYNLTTEKNHTYFANGIFVHNQKGDSARSVFKDTAYWNPTLKTSADGEANVRFTLPDNLTTWVVQGVAVAEGTSVGSKSEEVIVTKDTIIRPKLPNILRTGDKATIYASVSNYSSKSGTYVYKLEAENLKIAKPQGEVMLADQETKDVSWDIEALAPFKDLKMSFSLTAKENNEASDVVEQKIDVKEAVFVENDSKFAIGSKSYDFSIPQIVDLGKSKSKLILSNNIFATLGESVGYLIGYPYGCAEQTASRLQGLITAKKHKEVLAGTDYKESDLDSMIEESIKHLESLQRPGSGYAFWSGSHEDAFITMYAVLTLRELDEMGYKVNEEKLRFAHSYLMSDKAYKEIGSMVTKSKKLDDKEVALLAMRMLYEMSHKESTVTKDQLDIWASALDASKKTIGESIYWSEDNWARFGSKDASTGIALQALLKSNYWQPSDNALRVLRYLIESRKKEYFSNTFGTVQAIKAIFDTKSAMGTSESMSYQVMLNGAQYAYGKFDEKSTDVVVPIDLSKLKNGQNNKLNIIYKGGMGYSLFSTNLAYPLNSVKAKSSDISVVRTITNAEDPNMSIGLGDIVNVKLTVYAKDDNVKFYGVIADKLPAGMAPVNTRLKNDAVMARDDDGFWSSSFEYSADGATVSFYGLKKSGIEKTYQARVVAKGEFVVPPAVAELMYMPEVSAHTATQKIVIHEKSSLPMINQISKTTGSALASIFAPVQKIYDSITASIPPVIRDILALVMICVVVGLVIKYVRGKKKKVLEQSESPVDKQQEDQSGKVT